MVRPPAPAGGRPGGHRRLDDPGLGTVGALRRPVADLLRHRHAGRLPARRRRPRLPLAGQPAAPPDRAAPAHRPRGHRDRRGPRPGARADAPWRAGRDPLQGGLPLGRPGDGRGGGGRGPPLVAARQGPRRGADGLDRPAQLRDLPLALADHHADSPRRGHPARRGAAGRAADRAHGRHRRALLHVHRDADPARRAARPARRPAPRHRGLPAPRPRRRRVDLRGRPRRGGDRGRPAAARDPGHPRPHGHRQRLPAADGARPAGGPSGRDPAGGRRQADPGLRAGARRGRLGDARRLGHPAPGPRPGGGGRTRPSPASSRRGPRR